MLEGRNVNMGKILSMLSTNQESQMCFKCYRTTKLKREGEDIWEMFHETRNFFVEPCKS